MPSPLISIILCSFNGAATLPRTLEALAAMARPEGTEIVFVDNASTDGTAGLFPANMAGSEVRRLHEPRRGKSFALNTGLRAARGRFIAFMDDDVRPAPGWLDAYLAAAGAHPAADVFCGQIRPDFETEAPAWLAHLCEIGESFGTTPVALNRDGIQPVPHWRAKGANLFVRRSALEGVGFDEERFNYVETGGRGGDTDIVKRLTEGRSPPLFVPDALVHHWISRPEMALRVVRLRYRTIGQSSERRRWLDADLGPTKRRRVLLRYARYYARDSIGAVAARMRGDSARRAELEVGAAKLAGRIAYLRRRARGEA